MIALFLIYLAVPLRHYLDVISTLYSPRHDLHRVTSSSVNFSQLRVITDVATRRREVRVSPIFH